MVTLTPHILAACTGATVETAAKWLPWISAALSAWGIDTPQRVAMFLAQCGVESNGLLKTEENMNYSAKRLLQVFPSHFTVAQAGQYANRPRAIANRVYANRLGNGNEASGDGWRHRGMGLIQLTGKTEQEEYMRAAGITDPALISQPMHAANSAGWYWSKRKLNKFADAGNCNGCTRAINPAGLAAARRAGLYSGGVQVMSGGAL